MPNGRKIVVNDNIIPHDIVDPPRDPLNEFIENHAEYHETLEDDESADNVRWSIGHDEPFFLSGQLWAFMKQIATHISGVKTFHPYDISCNHIRRTRMDQNTGGALLEFSMRTAMHGTSCVSSAIFVRNN